jgi:hypothetical protein
MRKALLVMVLLCVACPHTVQSAPESGSSCFKRIRDDLKLEDTVRIYCDTGVVVAVRPIVSATASLLYVQPIVGNSRSGLAIPFETIDRITYRHPRGYGRELGLLGFLSGAVAGAIIGASAAPPSSGYMGFPEASYGFMGFVAGGVAGALLGHQIGKHIDRRITLRCF